MMRQRPLVDLLLLFIVFWTSWHYKEFFPQTIRGPLVIISTSLTALIIIRIRKLSTGDIGFLKRVLDKKFIKEVGFISLLIFSIQFFGILIIGALLGPPEQSSAIENQPESIIGFIVDVVFVTWIIIALGEEFLFRGIVINRLKAILGSYNLKASNYLIAGLQAFWFGAAHPSQGFSGMLITGIIGFTLGIYFLKNEKGGLWPLVIAHAFIDTLVLSITFISEW